MAHRRLGLLALAGLVAPSLLLPIGLAQGPGEILLCEPDEFPCCPVPAGACSLDHVQGYLASWAPGAGGLPEPGEFPEPPEAGMPSLDDFDTGPFEDAAGDSAGAALAIAGTLASAAGQVGGAAIPDASDAILLVGQGQAWAKRGSTQGDCTTPSWFVLEASTKPFTFEPTVTMAYGGAEGDSALAIACGMGQLRQPIRQEITGTFDGAWSAAKFFPNYFWTLEVGAPVDGLRTVSFTYESVDGLTRDTFEGVVSEHR